MSRNQTAIQSFYGVGPNIASRLCAKLSIHKTAQVGSLSTSKTMVLADELSKLTIENDLRRQLKDDLNRLKDMGSYRGRRHAQVWIGCSWRLAFGALTAISGIAGERTEDENSDQHGEKAEQGRTQRIDGHWLRWSLARSGPWASHCTIALAFGSV